MPTLAINSIKGVSSSEDLRSEGEFGASLGIDPLMPITDSDIRPSGFIRPTQFSKFSGATVATAPKWMVTTPKDTNCYVLCEDGKVHLVGSGLTMGTSLNSGNQIGAGVGNGMEYYNNALYIATTVNIAKLADLGGTPALDDDYWTAALSLTALTNTTYPSINGNPIPNHMMHRHTDNKMYICDVVDNAGALHYVKTTKTTVEGDTNDSSTYQALDFQKGWYPTTMCSFGTYLLIAFIEGVNTTVDQKPARLVLWDTVSDSFEDVTIDDNFSEPLITALQPLRDGSVMIFSGKATGGCRRDKFYGLNQVQPIDYNADNYPPFQGAVDVKGDRVVYGTKVTIPSAGACVLADGSHNPKIPLGLHNIAKSSASGANPQITALKYFVQSANKQMPIIGFTDDSSSGIDSLATTANTSLVLKAYMDNGSSNVTIATIQTSDSRFTSRRKIDIETGEVRGRNDFYLQLEWSNGAVYRSEKEIITGAFNIERIRFNLGDVIDASFVGSVQLPLLVDVSTDND